MTPEAIPQLECYKAALTFAQTEGIIIAPETSHAVAMAIRKAQEAKEEAKEKVIIFNLSGHGLMDLNGYDAYMAGKLFDYSLPQEDLAKSLESIQGHPAAPANKLENGSLGLSGNPFRHRLSNPMPDNTRSPSGRT